MTHLVIVTGPPASGKSMLGRRLTSNLRIPFLGKDDIKEALFESLGWRDRPWSQKMGHAAYVILYRMIEIEALAGRSLMVESNFVPEVSGPPMKALVSRYDIKPVQILCYADGEILMRRYVERDRAGERHPGHVDTVAYKDILPILRRGRIDPLPLPGPVIEVDTSDLAAIPYDDILRQVRDCLAD